MDKNCGSAHIGRSCALQSPPLRKVSCGVLLMELSRGGHIKALICVDGSPVTNEGFKCAVNALRTDIEYTLLYVLEEHGIYDSYKRIFKEDLERIEAVSYTHLRAHETDSYLV